MIRLNRLNLAEKLAKVVESITKLVKIIKGLQQENQILKISIELLNLRKQPPLAFHAPCIAWYALASNAPTDPWHHLFPTVLLRNQIELSQYVGMD